VQVVSAVGLSGPKMLAVFWLYAAAAVFAGLILLRFATQYHKHLEDAWNRGAASRERVEAFLLRRVSEGKDDPSPSGSGGSGAKHH